MQNPFLITAALSGALAVILGAFGAHALKARLGTDMLAVWQTAVQYHFIHTLALLFVGLLARQTATVYLKISGCAYLAGVLFFCGSLYWLALGGPRWLGPITPLGGVFFIAGWLCLGVGALRL